MDWTAMIAGFLFAATAWGGPAAFVAARASIAARRDVRSGALATPAE